MKSKLDGSKEMAAETIEFPDAKKNHSTVILMQHNRNTTA
jgi:hypothetical protein